jgi:imidazolonepropionase-like amidohydrolase
MIFRGFALMLCLAGLATCGGPQVSTAVPRPDAALRGVTLALVNGALIDGTGAGSVSDAVLLLAGDRIAAVGSHDAIRIPDGVRSIDVEGATILPGFINAHVHDAYDAERLAAWAHEGITTVRDEGLWPSESLEERLTWRDGQSDEPRHARLVSAGYMLRPPGGYGGFDIDSVAMAQREINQAVDWGVDQIKFTAEDGYAQWSGLPIFEQDVMDAIVESAHARGVRVSVHVCDARYLEAVLDAGVDDIAHIQYDHVADALIRRIVSQDVTVVPTLTVLEAFGSLEGSQRNLRRFVEAGVRIATGNDYTAVPQNNFDHFELGMPMHELRRMREAGMTPMQIIVASTMNGAHVCGLAQELGTLEAGKLADVLVVNGDPLADLEALADVRLVIHDGEVIRGE